MKPLAATLLLLSTMACSSSPPVECRTSACKLASLDTGSIVDESDPSVAAIQSRLDTLGLLYAVSDVELSDMTVKLQSILRDGGNEESLLRLLDGFVDIPHPAPGVPKYAEIAASYATLRQRGFTHDATVSGLRAMLKDLGRLQ